MNTTPSPALTIRELLTRTSPYLESKGSASPRLDAELLLAETLGVDRLKLYLDIDRPLHQDEIGQFREYVRRRAAREPLAYILGYREFYSLPFAVDSRALIPRPETEGVVELALESLDGSERPCIIDIGAGSGAIGIALARQIEGARLWATDICAEALALAQFNAAQLGVAGRIQFATGDLFAGLDGPFDLTVSNPPYIPEGDRDALQPDVGQFEPEKALFAGPDGLDVIRRLIREAPDRLGPGGKLVFEIGQGQAEAVERLLAEDGHWKHLSTVPDLQGIPRAVAAQRL